MKASRRTAAALAGVLTAWVMLLGYLAVIRDQPTPPSSLAWLIDHRWGALVVALLGHLLLASWRRAPTPTTVELPVPGTRSSTLWTAALTVWVAVIGGGVVLEVAQLFLPGRGQEFSDLTDNLLGATLGIAASGTLMMLVGPAGAKNRNLLLGGTGAVAVAALAVAVWAAFAYQPEPTSTCPDDLFIPADGVLAHYDFAGLDGTVVANSATNTDTALELSGTGIASGATGVTFSGDDSVGRSETSAGFLLCNIIAADAVSMELWASTASLDQNGPTRLATFSDGTASKNIDMHIGQVGTSVSVRVRNGPSNVQSMVVDNVLTEVDRPYHLVAWYADGEMFLAADGAIVGSRYIGRDLRWWADYFDLVVGNESTLDRPFRGTLHELTIRTRTPSAAALETWFRDRPTTLD